ncbi:MAG TPA: transglutaminaseTgpA domain-containing protein [Opitutaceae bacterium]|nr:transglutaminaseTgpA domain-containing protein [Opitutaceae bacterium]
MSGGAKTIRARLGLEELHQLRWALGGLLTLLAMGSIFYLEIDVWVLTGVAAAATVACLIWPSLPGRISPVAHAYAFPVIVAFFLGDLWLKGEALPAIVRLDVLLLLYRAIGYRTRREDLQIIVLGLFLIVVAGVLTVSLAFAVQIVAFAACALALLLVLTLVQAAEDGVPATVAAAPANVKQPVPRWVAQTDWIQLARRLRAASDWRLVVSGFVLFAGVVGLSTLLFWVIPRFQLENSLFLERFMMHRARTGFSDSIKFGDVTEIQQDTGVALSIDISDRSQLPPAPYWRMLVLDQYENGGFKISSNLRAAAFGPHFSTGLMIKGSERPRARAPVYWTFYLEAGLSRYLPMLGTFEELRFRETQNYQFARSLGLVALREEPATMIAYRVEGFNTSPLLPDAAFQDLWRERNKRMGEQVRFELEGADRDALTQAVAAVAAEKITANPAATPAMQFIERVNAWLRRNHGYSLSPKIPGGPGDPLVKWLTSREAGHCELFAGSLVLLARASGLPARVVTGFRGGSWNGYSNNLTLRNSDAHAWAEIFDEAQGGWLRADALGAPIATAGATATAEVGRVARVDRGWNARIESLRVFWYRRIVNFDQRTQVETLKAIKTSTEDTGRWLRETITHYAAELKAWLLAPWDPGRLARTGAGILALAAMVWAWREFGRNAWKRFLRRLNGEQEDPVRLDASRWLAKIAAAREIPPEQSAVIAELQRLRFGARATWPEPDPVFRRARHALRSARRRRRVTTD